MKVFECNGCDFKNSKMNLLKDHYKTNHLHKLEMPTSKNPFDKINQINSNSTMSNELRIHNAKVQECMVCKVKLEND